MSPAPALLLLPNAVAFVVYGADKWLAKRGRRRVPEAWLLGLAGALGFVGAWAGVRVFRHKTRKPSFLWKLGLVTLVELAALALLLSRPT